MFFGGLAVTAMAQSPTRSIDWIETETKGCRDRQGREKFWLTVNKPYTPEECRIGCDTYKYFTIDDRDGNCKCADVCVASNHGNQKSYEILPPRSLPPTPTTPGCHILAPWGCFNKPQSLSRDNTWHRDSWGERHRGSGKDKNVCLKNRKGDWNRWCGVSNIQMHFVSAKWWNGRRRASFPKRVDNVVDSAEGAFLDSAAFEAELGTDEIVDSVEPDASAEFGAPVELTESFDESSDSP